jgi:hypothetical protein
VPYRFQDQCHNVTNKGNISGYGNGLILIPGAQRVTVNNEEGATISSTSYRVNIQSMQGDLVNNGIYRLENGVSSVKAHQPSVFPILPPVD